MRTSAPSRIVTLARGMAVAGLAVGSGWSALALLLGGGGPSPLRVGLLVLAVATVGVAGWRAGRSRPSEGDEPTWVPIETGLPREARAGRVDLSGPTRVLALETRPCPPG